VQVGDLVHSVGIENLVLATILRFALCCLAAPTVLSGWKSQAQPSGGLQVGLDVICATGGCGPGEVAGCWLVEVPSRMLFQLVVIPA
jgi:hypothetical protein